MTPEESRRYLHLQAELWTLRCFLADVFQTLHLADDYAAFEILHNRHLAYQKDRLLTKLEDTDPALAALIDDREVSQLSELP